MKTIYLVLGTFLSFCNYLYSWSVFFEFMNRTTADLGVVGTISILARILLPALLASWCIILVLQDICRTSRREDV